MHVVSFLFLLTIWLSTKKTRTYLSCVLAGLIFGYLVLTILNFVFAGGHLTQPLNTSGYRNKHVDKVSELIGAAIATTQIT